MSGMDLSNSQLTGCEMQCFFISQLYFVEVNLPLPEKLSLLFKHEGLLEERLCSMETAAPCSNNPSN